MPIPQIKSINSIFRKTTFADGQAGIFRGRRRPEEPETPNETAEWFIEDDLDNTSNWTETLTGTASSSIVSGILTLQTGNTDESKAEYIHKINLGTVDEIGAITVEAKVKFTRTAQADICGAIGFCDSAKSDKVMIGLDPLRDGGIDWNGTTGAAGIGDLLAYSGAWHIVKIEFRGGNSIHYFIDGVDEGDLDFEVSIPSDEDMFLYIFLQTRNANKDQKMEIDWIRMKYGL